jgi:molecular chaperone GrpE
MDPNQDTDNSEYSFELTEDEAVEESVDDFIKELEAKEKDLHITAETTFIEIAADFEEDELPDFLKPELTASGPTTVQPAVPAAPAQNGPQSAALEKEISVLKDKITAMQTERSELFENSIRRSKDFEAYKARTERERGETFQKQLSNLATQMLPVLDNLDRALKFASEMPGERRNEFVQFFEGIVLVNQQVNEVLSDMGIDPIITVGEPFDPQLHEAVALDESSDLPANTISEEVLRGFRIGDSVIRHSMVKVSQPAPVSEPSKIATTDVFGEYDLTDGNDGEESSETSGVPRLENPADDE